MTELKSHDITIRYIGEEHPEISSTRTPAELAKKLRWEWWDYRFGPEPQILSITIDGEVFE